MAKFFSDYDMFDLEQDIIKCYDVCQNIDNFLRKFCNDPEPMSEDEVYNIVSGIKEVHSIQVDRLFDGFNNLRNTFITDTYTPDTEVETEVKSTKKRSSK